MAHTVIAHSAGRDWSPVYHALEMGMDSLQSAVLPRGVREIRVQVECGLCTPEYLFRIRTGPGQHIDGEAYILQARGESAPSDTAGTRIEREYNAGVAVERSALRCHLPALSAGEHWDACKIGLPIRWNSVVTMIERSGILDVVADTGHAPDPPTDMPLVIRVDTAQRFPPPPRDTVRASGSLDLATGVRKLPVDTISPLPFRRCYDLGGQSMTVEVLHGSKYGTASFWCLEVRGPVGAEHDRAASVRQILLALVHPKDRRAK